MQEVPSVTLEADARFLYELHKVSNPASSGVTVTICRVVA